MAFENNLYYIAGLPEPELHVNLPVFTKTSNGEGGGVSTLTQGYFFDAGQSIKGAQTVENSLPLAVG